MKTCRDCGETKPLEDFSRARQCKDGIRNFCKKCAAAKAARWQKENPEKVRAIEAKKRLRRYGITNVEVLGEAKCSSCGSTDDLCVDHNHDCCGKGKACESCVRGWLCRSCNMALGLLQDNPVRVRQLLGYISRHRGANG